MRRPFGSNCFPSRPPCRPPELAPCSPRCSLASSLRSHARKFGGRPLPANVALRHDRGGGAKVAQCKNRGKLKSGRATSGASRPLARTASTPDSKVSGPLAATAMTPDSKVTRQQASSKQCAGKRAASRGERADNKRRWKRMYYSHHYFHQGRGWQKVAAGAEGACQETDAEHWQRHSSHPGAHLCCRCNFIKRKKAKILPNLLFS